MTLSHASPPNTWPSLGIRPAIDGRLGGVRESLEGQTMGMALRVADFLSRNVRYPDGTPLRCVIAPSCIGGVAEAAAAAAHFAREGVGISLTVTPCWCYGSETMDMDPLLPKAIWGFNGTERPGAVYLAAVQAAHNQKGLPIFTIYGRDVQDASDTLIPPDVREKLLTFTKAGLGVAIMRGRAYLGMGHVSMGIMGSYPDHSFFEQYLGMRVESVDMVEFVRRMDRGIYDAQEYDRALAWTREHCKEGFDPNPVAKRFSSAEKERAWEISVKMALIARDLMQGNPRLAEMGFGEEAQGHHALVAGFQGQRQWTDHLPNGDFMEAILCSSFDWNGPRRPLMLATENDALNGVSMLMGYLLGHGAQIFADVRTYWSPEAVKRVARQKPSGPAAKGFLHLINSGPAALDGTGWQTRKGKPAIKPFWEVTPSEISKCLKATSWHSAVREYFPGGGFSTRYRTRGGMPVTLCRINLVRGLGPVLQIAEGTTLTLPSKMHDALDQRTNPTWPTTWFAPRLTGDGAFRDVYSVMNAWGSNHGAFGYGHIGHELITMASMLRIPVYMHNVQPARIFRPSAWHAFGTAHPESADFRACQTFGPLYG